MRKAFTLSLLGLLVCAFASPAAVIVYKQRIRFNATGGGTANNSVATGYIVIDPDTADVVSLNVLAKWKFYGVQVWQEYQWDQVRPKRGAQSTVITQSRVYQDEHFDFQNMDCGFAKGKNSTIVAGEFAYTIPKVFTWRGNSVYPSPSGEATFETSAGTLVYDAKQTKICNGFGDTVDSAIDRLKQTYVVKPGYSERFYQ